VTLLADACRLPNALHVTRSRDVLTADFRGWSRSSAVPDPYALGQLADDTLAVLADAGGGTDYLLAGRSTAGKVAQSVAATRPAGLRGIVLVGSGPAKPAAQITPEYQQVLSHAYDSADSVTGARDHIPTATELPASNKAQIVTDARTVTDPTRTEWPLRGLAQDEVRDLGGDREGGRAVLLLPQHPARWQTRPENSVDRPARLGHDPHVTTYLESERLILRPFAADDADLLIELDSDPAVMRYLTGGAPTPPEEVRDLAIPSILAGYERWDHDLGLFAAHEKDGGALVGWFCLRPLRSGPREEAELGYRLRQAAWGRGYATEVSQALLAKGFAELGIRMVWAETMTVNRPSRNVMEKLGMTLAETIPTPDDMMAVEGSEHGGVRYEITKEQWERRQA
jgi:RimJ/RimL family protein N-acetyltransferase